MNNEFEKLDAFMSKHAPPPGEVPALHIQPSPTAWMKYIFASLLVAVVVTVYQLKSHSYDENTLALSEVMEWDVTSDEMPTEVEDLIAWTE